jgi:hypothetical protein
MVRLRLAPVLTAVLAGAVVLAGCGGGATKTTTGSTPQLGKSGTETQASQQLGFPGFATKNTTRVGGADSVADAAAVARAVYPGGAPGTQPAAVALVGASDWRTGLAASVLMSRPLGAPLLLSDAGKLPQASSDALAALAPTGANELGGAQVIRVGRVPAPAGSRSTSIAGSDPYTLAAAIDRLASAVAGKPSRAVIVVSADDPAYAMPAAGYAAKSGDPILFVRRNEIPGPTYAALQAHEKPHIYVLGPVATVSRGVERALRSVGTVTRIRGADPVRNAIAFARFNDGTFGWGVVDPGHGLVFANAGRPLDAAAAAPLSASGTYGPLLLMTDAATLPVPLGQYLLDIQPGYQRDPVRGVYNHGWLIGDASAISLPVQSRIDSLLEISQVKAGQ